MKSGVLLQYTVNSVLDCRVLLCTKIYCDLLSCTSLAGDPTQADRPS